MLFPLCIACRFKRVHIVLSESGRQRKKLKVFTINQFITLRKTS